MYLTRRLRFPKIATRTRPARRAGLAALLIAAFTLVPIPAAHAVDSTTCTGTTHVSYDPGLTLTPQTVELSESDSVPSCTSTDSTVTSVVTQPYGYPVAGAACNNVAIDPGETLVIHWNNSQTSTVSSLTYTTALVAGVSVTTGTGTVSAGEFNGDAVVITWTYALVNPLLCLQSGGLTSQNGTIIAEVTG